MATRSITRSCVQLTASLPTSTSQSFLKTATSVRSFHFTSTPLSVPEFLAPRLHSPINPYSRGSRGFRRLNIRPESTARQFSTTGRARATITAFNPQKNEDGSEQTIEITARAAQRLQQLRAKENNPNLALRVEVQSGGCHGFQYMMSLCDVPTNISRDIFNTSASSATTDESSNQIQEESTPALNTSSSDPNAMPSSSSSPSATSTNAMDLREDDIVFNYVDEQSQAAVVMDVFSLDALKGSKIDYEVKLIGAEFKIVDNPAATSSCGCGTSFDIKF